MVHSDGGRNVVELVVDELVVVKLVVVKLLVVVCEGATLKRTPLPWGAGLSYGTK